MSGSRGDEVLRVVLEPRRQDSQGKTRSMPSASAVDGLERLHAAAIISPPGAGSRSDLSRTLPARSGSALG